jgi:AcrR family transcriptional regulator
VTDAVDRIREAIERGELGPDDLTARGIAAALGRTTSVLYHHWGSLDAFLYEVAQSGFVQLGRTVAGLDLAGAAEAYVRFAVERPALYHLMFHRAWDWDELRRHRDLRYSAGFLLWQGAVDVLRAGGSADPETDARVLYGGLHGLASLAISGRANVGDLSRTDVESAVFAARRLVGLVRPLAPPPPPEDP